MIFGTLYADHLWGSGVIKGRGGDDHIFGASGDDMLAEARATIGSTAATAATTCAAAWATTPSGRVLPRHQPQPGGELPSATKHRWVGYRGRDRCGG
jgi:hypothetical protein